MSNNDLVTMVGNLGRSLPQVQALVSGLGYLLGIVFIFAALGKCKEMGEQGSPQGKVFSSVAYFLTGAALLYLPSMLQTLSTTLFGTSNVLEYATKYNPYDIYSSMHLLIQTSGLIWFVRGCVLLAQASEPGEQHGPKGLTFVFAGILAMNFESTMGWLDYILTNMMNIVWHIPVLSPPPTPPPTS